MTCTGIVILRYVDTPINIFIFIRQDVATSTTVLICHIHLYRKICGTQLVLSFYTLTTNENISKRGRTTCNIKWTNSSQQQILLGTTAAGCRPCIHIAAKRKLCNTESRWNSVACIWSNHNQYFIIMNNNFVDKISALASEADPGIAPSLREYAMQVYLCPWKEMVKRNGEGLPSGVTALNREGSPRTPRLLA